MNIVDTKLPTRAKNALIAYGISTVKEMKELGSEELFLVPDLGRKMVSVIQRFIEKDKK